MQVQAHPIQAVSVFCRSEKKIKHWNWLDKQSSKRIHIYKNMLRKLQEVASVYSSLEIIASQIFIYLILWRCVCVLESVYVNHVCWGSHRVQKSIKSPGRGIEMVWATMLMMGNELRATISFYQCTISPSPRNNIFLRSGYESRASPNTFLILTVTLCNRFSVSNFAFLFFFQWGTHSGEVTFQHLTAHSW